MPLILTLVFAAPFWMLSARIKGWQALIVGFVLSNLLIVAVDRRRWPTSSFDWVAGLLWFLGKTYAFVFTFVWMRGTLPRVRIDQLMDFAWKWLLPGVAAQPLRDRRRDRRGRQGVRPRDEPRPGPRHRQGHGADPAPLLRAQGHDHVPRGAGRRSRHKFRGRLQLLYDEWGTLKCETCFQCAQACPIECIDMGGIDTSGRFHVHWGAPETYGERREESALRRSGRTVPGPGLPAVRRAIDLAPLDAILDEYDHDPARMLEILEATQAAYGYLPVAALKRISQRTGAWYAMIYGTATYYSHLRFEPAEATGQAAAVDRRTGRPRRPTSRRSGPRSAAQAGGAGKPARAVSGMVDLLKTPGRLADDPASSGPRRPTRPTSTRRSAPAPSTACAGSIRNLGATGDDRRRSRASGLRGRGGAGFPTADKWRTARRRPTPPRRYVVVNGYGADPADRHGPLPARARPVRASSRAPRSRPSRSAPSEAIIAVRADATEAIRRLEAAIGAAEEAGFIGVDVLGSGHDIDGHGPAGPGRLHARRGDRPAQGPRGQARPARAAPAASRRARPVRHADRRPQRPDRSRPCRGSSATAPRRSRRSASPRQPRHDPRPGPDAGRRRRSPRSRSGRRCASVVGARRQAAAPVAASRRSSSAARPAGCCRPSSLDTPYDFEPLRAAGAHVGSGSVVVADDRACVVDLARLLTRFCADEACGKTIPCRIGTRRLVEIADRVDRRHARARPTPHLLDGPVGRHRRPPRCATTSA